MAKRNKIMYHMFYVLRDGPCIHSHLLSTIPKYLLRNCCDIGLKIQVGVLNYPWESFVWSYSETNETIHCQYRRKSEMSKQFLPRTLSLPLGTWSTSKTVSKTFSESLEMDLAQLKPDYFIPKICSELRN